MPVGHMPSVLLLVSAALLMAQVAAAPQTAPGVRLRSISVRSRDRRLPRGRRRRRGARPYGADVSGGPRGAARRRLGCHGAGGARARQPRARVEGGADDARASRPPPRLCGRFVGDAADRPVARESLRRPQGAARGDLRGNGDAAARHAGRDGRDRGHGVDHRTGRRDTSHGHRPPPPHRPRVARRDPARRTVRHRLRPRRARRLRAGHPRDAGAARVATSRPPA